MSLVQELFQKVWDVWHDVLVSKQEQVCVRAVYHSCGVLTLQSCVCISASDTEIIVIFVCNCADCCVSGEVVKEYLYVCNVVWVVISLSVCAADGCESFEWNV